MRILELPLTLVRIPVEVARRTGGTALGAARFAYGVVARRGQPATDDVEPEPFRVEPEPVVAEPEPLVAEPEPVVPEPEAVPEEELVPEPVHVSEEPELVAAVAESGAEDGAGAEVHVDQPWPEYDRMNATEIRARLAGEGSEAAAAVSLYEASRKGRRSILEAAARTMAG